METRDKRVGTKMKTEETTKKKLKVGIFSSDFTKTLYVVVSLCSSHSFNRGIKW